ncbi:MAG: extracellular solute-binding protein [Candidatus Caccosoma sp.]|nr:extracellular solute-binding protein [Candidatus Caccosoma sp.]
MKNKKLIMLSLIPLLATTISSCGDKNDESSSEIEYSFSQEEEVLKMIPQEVLNANAEIDLLVYIEGQEGTINDIGNYSNDPNDTGRKWHPKDVSSHEMVRWFATASAFKKIAPGVKINLKFTSIDRYNNKIKEYYDATGHLPELMWGVDHVVEMLQKGYCTDLSEYSSSEYYQAYNEYFMSRFNFGNCQAAFPISAEPWGVFVNLDILEDPSNPVVTRVFEDGYCTDEYKEWVDNLTIDTFTDAVKKTNNAQHAGLSKVVEYFTSYAMASINESFIRDGKIDLTSEAVKAKLQNMLTKENELSQYCTYVYDKNSTGRDNKQGFNVQNWHSTQDFALDHECTFFAESPWALPMVSQYINSAVEEDDKGLPKTDDDGNYIPNMAARNTKVDFLPYPKADADSDAYTGIAVEGMVIGNQFRMENGQKVPTQKDAKLKQDIAAYFTMFSNLDPRALKERTLIKYIFNGQEFSGSLSLPLIKQNFKFSWQNDPEKVELMGGDPSKDFDDNWSYQLSEWFKLYKVYLTNDDEPDVTNFTNMTYGLVKMLDSIYALENVGDESDNYVRCLNYWNEPVKIEVDGVEKGIFDKWQSRFTTFREEATDEKGETYYTNVIGTDTYVGTIMDRLSEMEEYINSNSQKAWAYLSELVNTMYYDEDGNPLYPDITDRDIRNHYEGSRY